MKTIRSRVLLILLLLAGSIFSLLPRTVTDRSFDPATGRMVEQTVRRIPIHLGLDLRGGSHFTLVVDSSRASVTDCDAAVEAALRVIRNRVGEFGTTQPVIQAAGPCRLIVELPGENDFERARSIVQRTAFLEFRLVDESDRYDALAGAVAAERSGTIVRGQMPGQYLVPEADVARVDVALQSQGVRRAMPRNTELRWGADLMTVGGVEYRPIYTVDARALLTGEKLVDATAARDPLTARPEVHFELTRSAGRTFADATGSHIGDEILILLDGRVQGTPAVIRDRIDSTGRIELPAGSFQDASDLALVLRAGALPVPLRIADDGTVGPSLGADSVSAGVRTSLLAVALVVLVIVLYYRFSGVLAALALGMYLIYCLGGLAVFGFTLTLPGIAGFALAIGMAVDANVLIFERIREELPRTGSVRQAVDRGFRYAMSAIIDSNVTTALTALILHRIGTDAVKGFAVTLLCGICASMFAAVFVTRTLFLIWLERRGRRTQLRLRSIRPLTEARYDFMRWRRPVLAASGVLIVAGLLTLAVRGVPYGVDFTGGTMLQVHTEQPVPMREIRAALATSPLAAAQIQSYGSPRDFIIRTGQESAPADASGSRTVREQAMDALDAGLGAGAWEIVRTEGVGPRVGDEMQQKAAAAVAASFAATLAYLAVRFESRFGLAAVLATAHDIFGTLAFMGLLHVEVSLVTVAGILTVLGYSLNDTIVIFDRVRENMRSRKRAHLSDVLNDSIAETLPRTLLTAGTTLLAALLLALFAGQVIRPLALVMSFGIAIGTLSSIFVASPLLLWLSHRAAPSPAREKRWA